MKGSPAALKEQSPAEMYSSVQFSCWIHFAFWNAGSGFHNNGKFFFCQQFIGAESRWNKTKPNSSNFRKANISWLILSFAMPKA